jgi:hypothetical protein
MLSLGRNAHNAHHRSVPAQRFNLAVSAARPGHHAQQQEPQQQTPNSSTPDARADAAVQQMESSYIQKAASQSAPQPPAQRAAAGSRPLRPLLRRVPLKSALPVLRTVRFAERRLEADVLTIATTVMLVVGYIIWDRGVEELLDNIFGEGPKGSVFCILMGLGLVSLVRFAAGSKILKIFSV